MQSKNSAENAGKWLNFETLDVEQFLNIDALRSYRLGRIRRQLARLDFQACILFDPINLRYATGTRSSQIFSMHIPTRYAFVAAEGPVVLFYSDSPPEVKLDPEGVTEVRLATPLSFFFVGNRSLEAAGRWLEEIKDLAQKHLGGGRRLALDRSDPRLAIMLSNAGFEIGDAQEVLEHARAIKSAEEIACMRQSVAVAEVGLTKIRSALSAGITENELWSILHQVNIAMGGEWIETRLLSSGPRTNPWFQECGGRMIRPGDLVALDTDMVGPMGYCADISRTFHCGPGKPTAAQRELYKLAYEEVHHNLDLIRPGVSFRELSESSWRHPEDFVANRYAVLAHGIGMCDEYPAIAYPQDWEALGYDGLLEDGMTICVESYIGREGGSEGVKLEQQVLITGTGTEVLSNFPFEEDLLQY
jgi:Xaa-Pro aminopeptidase